eukprot:TRINITY_DN8467_c0_g1_i1.p1 TRINITY_DN8467_c0_g1~~TRINITY_DN8467_c0_g1_i1.p1  ORF type:complete len:188 (-),score=55.89 TRINITY_DN8467_c0_g1_i1:87-650(-)
MSEDKDKDKEKEKDSTALTNQQYQSLLSLRTLKTKTAQLEKTRARIEFLTETAQNEDVVIAEFQDEKEKLKLEAKKVLSILQGIQEDISVVDTAIENVTKEKEKIFKEIKGCTERFFPLKEEVDTLRASFGLPKIPNIQAVQDRKASNYLEQRRLAFIQEDSINSSLTEKASTSTTPSKKRRKKRFQ